MVAGAQKRLRVDQALHGYRDGHRLLAASQRLDDFSASTMARMSDMQPRSVGPSESYVCGYPLPHANRYVIARTWLAGEMRRPGCVWTHSLLLDYGAVAQIESLANLLALLTRPSFEALETYELALDITDLVKVTSTQDVGAAFAERADESRLYSILFSLYGPQQPSTAFARKAGDSKDEAIVGIVWGQMPPRLRREFVFCTSGSMMSASFCDASLCLVLADDVDTASQNVGITQKATAIEYLVRDALRGDRSVLRGFLSRYITDAIKPRAAVSPLTEIAFALSQRELFRGVREAASRIAIEFPSAGDCELLKKDLLTGHIFEGISPESLLASSLPPMKHLPKLGDVKVAQTLAAQIVSDASLLNVLLADCSTAEFGTLGRDVFDSIMRNLRPIDVATLDIAPLQKYEIMSSRPDVFADPLFWHHLSPPLHSKEWVELWDSSRTPLFVSALLKAKQYAILHQLATRAPAVFVSDIASALGALSHEDQQEAVASLRPMRDGLLAHIARSPTGVFLLEVFACDVVRHRYPLVPPQVWAAIVEALPLQDSPMGPYSLFVTFQSALRLRLREAVPLYMRSFQLLHDCVTSGVGEVASEIREAIRKSFRTFYHLRTADAGEVLRANLCSHFEYEGQPDVRLFRCAGDSTTVDALAKSMVQIPGGYRWLNHFLKGQNTGQQSAMDEDVRAAVDALAWRKGRIGW
ncbi:GAP1-N1 domain-containing protein [Ralstonia pseudosolanacearum]